MAREFWLIFEAGYSPWISSKPLFSADTSEEIHVIEYAAYENLKARLERAEALLELTNKRYFKM